MKQNNQLQAALILLENVFYGARKYNRQEFLEVLEQNELSSSATTITRLLGFINTIFGVDLSFKTKNGRIEIIDDTDNRYLFVKTLLLFGKLKNDSILLTSNIISYSSDSLQKNIELVLEVLDAISKHKTLKITYQKFDNSHSETHILKPLLLKEYLGRWYLYAENEKDERKVYGIDRILEFEKLNKKFSPVTLTNNPFENTIGVNFSGELEQIKLWVEDYQLKLFETFPIHSSQKIYERDDKGGILELEVVLNYEFKQLLASYLLKVKVLEPAHLQTEMIDIFEQMKKNYES